MSSFNSRLPNIFSSGSAAGSCCLIHHADNTGVMATAAVAAPRQGAVEEEVTIRKIRYSKGPNWQVLAAKANISLSVLRFACCQGNHHTDDDGDKKKEDLKICCCQEVRLGEHLPHRRPSAGRSRSFQAQQESSVPVQASWHDNRRPTVDAHRPAATFLLRPSAPPQDAVGPRCCLGWRTQAPPTPRHPPASALQETALKNGTPSGGVRWQALTETMGADEGRERRRAGEGWRTLFCAVLLLFSWIINLHPVDSV